jgi:LPS-assembly protein
LLQEVIKPEARKQLPTFLESNSFSESASQLTTLEGQVALRRGEIFLKADKVDYDQAEDFAKARGNVYINRAGNVYQGPALDLQLDAFEGFFTQLSTD